VIYACNAMVFRSIKWMTGRCSAPAHAADSLATNVREAFQSDLFSRFGEPMTATGPRKRAPRKSSSCRICNHPHRALIEAARIAGVGLDAIAAKYGVSRDSVHRHTHRHVSDDLRAEYLAAVPLKELAAKAVSEGMSLIEYLSIVRTTLLRQFQLAATLNDRHGTAVLAGRLTEVLREIGKLTGELGVMANSLTINGNVNVLNSPVIANLQASMLRALGPYPDARAAVVDALRRMDAETVPSSPLPIKTIEHAGAA
jgi:hypothetical protein